MGKIISVIGASGVGKSTLVSELLKIYDFQPAAEQHIDRPFQLLFKSDARYAFPNQVDYLLFRAEQEITLRASSKIGLIDGGLDLDYHGFSKLFHSKGLLTDSELDVCRRFYNFCRSSLPLPDLLIYLFAKPEIIRERLALRNRINIAEPEDTIILSNLIEEWLESLNSIVILRLDVSNVSESYTELMPSLKSIIYSKLNLDAGSYESEYIP